MSYCYLCACPVQTIVSWQTLLLKAFPKVLCTRCEEKFEPVQNNDGNNHISLYMYNEAMKTYLHQYKFLQDVVLAQVFSEKIYKVLHNQQVVIVPIPMHPEKIKERTFAHVDELLNAARVPYIHLLEKKSTKAQSSKTLQERLNSEPLFCLKENADVKPVHYMLVDDIYTTGTTLRHAESILRNHGAKEVSTFTLIKG